MTSHVPIQRTSSWAQLARLAGRHYLALAFITLSVFGQLWQSEFVNYDDDEYVYDNSHVTSGLSVENIIWAFSDAPMSTNANWFPLTWLSLMFDAEIYGLYAGGYHLTNVLIHTASVLLLFAALRRMTGDDWKSVFVAALFAIHPLHVESVAWVSERKGLLSTFFGLFTIWAYARYVSQPGAKWYLVALTAYICSLMSKQMLVTLPIVLLLLDFWPLARSSTSESGVFGSFGSQMPGDRIMSRLLRLGRANRSHSSDQASASDTRSDRGDASPEGRRAHPWSRLIWEKTPFFLVTIAFCFVAVEAQRRGGALQTLTDLPLATRCANTVLVYLLYMAQMVWPAALGPHYPHPGETISLVSVSLAATLLCLITAAAFWQRTRRPFLLVGWFWYLGTLVPVSGLVQTGLIQMADRYTDFPLIGLLLATAWFVPSLMPFDYWQKIVLPLLAGTIVVLLIKLSWVQTSHWKNSITLFEHAISVNDDNCLAHNNLSVALRVENRLEESIHHAKQAIRIDPDSVRARVNLGITLCMHGQQQEGIQQFRHALNRDPDNLRAHFCLSRVLSDLGELKEARMHAERFRAIEQKNSPATRQLLDSVGNLRQ